VNSLLQGQWKKGKVPKEKIKQALKKRILHLDDTSTKFERRPYAKSHILRYTKERCRRQGVVYAAFVPHGMGKTTACYAFLQKYAANKFLFLSPPDSSQTYVDNILNIDSTLFGLEKEKAASGFVTGLIDAMDQPHPYNKPPYLLLDEFMPQGPNLYDSDLIFLIKSLIQERNVVVVVLAFNKDSANHLVTLNNFEGIQPLIDVSSICEIKNAEGFTIPSTFQLDWAKHASMEWDAEEMKIALLTDHRLIQRSPESQH
jgi:hypothetical protein